MTIAPEILAGQLAADESPLVVDVRSQYEYTSGHVPGAVHLPFWKAPLLIPRYAASKEADVVLYCEHGPRAVLAARLLRLRGYHNVRLLKGHMHRWRREGRNLES